MRFCAKLFNLIITHLFSNFLFTNATWTMISKGWSYSKNPADLEDKVDDHNQQKCRKCTRKGDVFRKIWLLVYRNACDYFWTKSKAKINYYKNRKIFVSFTFVNFFSLNTDFFNVVINLPLNGPFLLLSLHSSESIYIYIYIYTARKMLIFI